MDPVFEAYRDMLNGVPRHIVDEYSHGKCMYLALALHERHGWPMHVQVEHDGSIAHAYVKRPHDGAEVDILGPQKQVDQYTSHTRQVSKEEMLSMMGGDRTRDAEHLARAHEIADKYVNHKLT